MNFGRQVLDNMWFGCGNALFLNYWHVNACVFHGHRALDDTVDSRRRARRQPAGEGINAGFNTDARKWISLDGHGGRDWNEFGGWNSHNGVSVNLKPLPSLTLSIGPQFVRSRDLAQYVDSFDDRPSIRHHRSDPAEHDDAGELDPESAGIATDIHAAAARHQAGTTSSRSSRRHARSTSANFGPGAFTFPRRRSRADIRSTRTRRDRLSRSRSTTPTSTSSRCA